MKIGKVVSIVICIFLLTNNIIANAFTNKELDKLYAQGVNAVIKCQKERTQKSVNEARAIIKKFKGNLDWAIGELSRQVDSVQHPILVSIVDGISRNQKKPSQEDINKIRYTISILPEEQWITSYASALDKAQQVLINDTDIYVKKYLHSRLTSDKEIAISKLNILKKSTNKSVVDWSNSRIKDMDKVSGSTNDSSISINKRVFMKNVEDIIFKKVNEQRNINGIGVLEHSDIMAKYARIKSKDMGDNSYFDHKDLQGNFITVEMVKDGITFRSLGENIAYIGGIDSKDSDIILAQKVIDIWMNSKNHRENILSTEFSSTGVGVYKVGNVIYATQEFYR